METRRSLSYEDTKKSYFGMEDVLLAEAKTTICADAAGTTSEDAEKHKENWSKVTEQFRKNGKATEKQTRASDTTAKNSRAANLADNASTNLSSFLQQNEECIRDCSSEIANKAEEAIFNRLQGNKDVVTSSLVSQNTDAIKKLSEYSTDSLLNNTFTSNTVSEENQHTTSSFEQHSEESSVLTPSLITESVEISLKSIEELEKITRSLITQTVEVKTDPLQKIRSVPFNPEELQQRAVTTEEALTAVNGFRSVQLNVESNNQVGWCFPCSQ